MRMFVGGSRTPAFEAVLEAVLRELGVVVLDRATVRTSHARYEWAKAHATGPAAMLRGKPAYELPTIAVADVSDEGGISIDVRSPRLPMWNLGLVRRLSARLGVWGAAMINDRLFDHYGTGIYYAGHTITGAAREISRLVYSAGGDTAPWFEGHQVEERNAARFEERETRLGGGWRFRAVDQPLRVLGIAPAAGGSLHDLEDQVAMGGPEARAWVELDPPPVTQAILHDRRPDFVAALRSAADPLSRTTALLLAGWELDVHTFDELWLNNVVDPETDGQPLTVATLRSATHDVAALVRALDQVPVAAAILRFGLPGGAVEVWQRAAGQAFTRSLVQGFDAVMDAYLPVTRLTECGPIRWDRRMR